MRAWSWVLLGSLAAAQGCNSESGHVGTSTSSTSASATTGGTGGVIDDGGTPDPKDADASDPCPYWMDAKMGGPCAVTSEIECGGNAEQWMSYCYLRCCGGHWLGPATVNECGAQAPPCP